MFLIFNFICYFFLNLVIKIMVKYSTKKKSKRNPKTKKGKRVSKKGKRKVKGAIAAGGVGIGLAGLLLLKGNKSGDLGGFGDLGGLQSLPPRLKSKSKSKSKSRSKSSSLQTFLTAHPPSIPLPPKARSQNEDPIIEDLGVIPVGIIRDDVTGIPISTVPMSIPEAIEASSRGIPINVAGIGAVSVMDNAIPLADANIQDPTAIGALALLGLGAAYKYKYRKRTIPRPKAIRDIIIIDREGHHDTPFPSPTASPASSINSFDTVVSRSSSGGSTIRGSRSSSGGSTIRGSRSSSGGSTIRGSRSKSRSSSKDSFIVPPFLPDFNRPPFNESNYFQASPKEDVPFWQQYQLEPSSQRKVRQGGLISIKKYEPSLIGPHYLSERPIPMSNQEMIDTAAASSAGGGLPLGALAPLSLAALGAYQYRKSRRKSSRPVEYLGRTMSEENLGPRQRNIQSDQRSRTQRTPFNVASMKGKTYF
jgi:hypothetical protein